MTNKKKVLTIFLLIVITISTLACFGFYDAGSTERESPADITDFPKLEIYSFDPEVDLRTLKQHDTNVLTLSSVVTPEEYVNLVQPPATGESPLWKYNQYMELAGLIQKQTWEDDAKLKWNLLSMFFDSNCQDPLDGFATTDLFYFRLATVDGESRYDSRELLINPLRGNVVSGSGASYPGPPLRDWKSIDLTKLKITPDTALQIAEKNGGQNFRIANKNNCYVYLSAGAESLSAGSEGWSVSYTSKQDQLERFEINIDPYTGKFEILSQ